MSHQPPVVPRPWTAQPIDPHDPDGAWEVVGRSLHGNWTVIVATYLSKEDARFIASTSRGRFTVEGDTPDAEGF